MGLILESAIALAGTMLLASPAAEDDQVICVGGPNWRPSLADAARIDAEPVPASYRTFFESKAPCVRWALAEASIVDWHLRFGDERTVSIALAYLERDYGQGIPAAGRYRSELARAWRVALPDLHRTQKIEQRPNLGYSARHRFMEKSPTIRRFNGLVDAREKHRFLAEQYLRAAEEFGSASLLGKASLYLRVTLDGTEFLEALESQEPAAGLLDFNLHPFITDDLQMRAAILRAGLSRSAQDIAEAERIVQSFERPLYRRLAETVSSGGDDFCDISDGWSEAEALRAACEQDEDSIRERLTNYWIDRAMLDFVTGNRKARSDELAFRLLERERSGQQGRCCYRRAEEDLLRLRLLSAEDHRCGVERSGSGEHDPVLSWREALDELREAEKLASVHSSPARFRRIALAWLETWERGEALLKTSETEASRADMPEHRRYAAYLRNLLEGVSAIAVGEEKSASPR
jgi:hypothetical protein